MEKIVNIVGVLVFFLLVVVSSLFLATITNNKTESVNYIKDSLKAVIAQYDDSLKTTQKQLNTTTAQLAKQDSLIKLLTQNRQNEILKIDTLTVGELYNYFKEY